MVSLATLNTTDFEVSSANLREKPDHAQTPVMGATACFPVRWHCVQATLSRYKVLSARAPPHWASTPSPKGHTTFLAFLSYGKES